MWDLARQRSALARRILHIPTGPNTSLSLRPLTLSAPPVPIGSPQLMSIGGSLPLHQSQQRQLAQSTQARAFVTSGGAMPPLSFPLPDGPIMSGSVPIPYPNVGFGS
ncbi:hypothetical protein [Lichenifustis flavocetrariae]|uniref:Uncharacterized protein n=1 Tax=Lichenifustis flavocetrariae TaxID=2949735 RepID=A0AA41YW28_9HYPH|nr:hypothetical protein [Lichenifustis flavocetrariae]MCW6509674.1 hypothetical protein [Lichenifustis flavocetrariae]